MLEIIINNKKTNKIFKGFFENKDEASEWKKYCILNNSWGQPDEYEITENDISEEIETNKRIDKAIEKGLYNENACAMILRYISGTNSERNLTEDAIKRMEQKFADVETLLRKGMPKTVKNSIDKISADGELITEQIKSDILKILKRYDI